jgi:hypothetical protein
MFVLAALFRRKKSFLVDIDINFKNNLHVYLNNWVLDSNVSKDGIINDTVF